MAATVRVDPGYAINVITREAHAAPSPFSFELTAAIIEVEADLHRNTRIFVVFIMVPVSSRPRGSFAITLGVLRHVVTHDHPGVSTVLAVPVCIQVERRRIEDVV